MVRLQYEPVWHGNRPDHNTIKHFPEQVLQNKAAKPFSIMETTVQHPAKTETSASTKNKNRISIDLLNDAIGREIATTLQYMYFHARFEDARYQHLSRIMREISIAEMRHTEEFSDRIFFLEGDVNMNPAFQARQMSDTAEMLQFAMQLEQSTIDFYNEASRMAAEHKDAVTHKMFQDIIAEEEEHMDVFRTELQNLHDYGENYLALQSVAGSKHAAENLHRVRQEKESEE